MDETASFEPANKPGNGSELILWILVSTAEEILTPGVGEALHTPAITSDALTIRISK